jgi:hypothetical protein
MHCFEDLQFKFEICREIKKRRKYIKYSKNLLKNTKNRNQAVPNVPLAKKKLNSKTKKNHFFAESLVGPSAKVPVPRVGRRHRRVLCRRPQLALGTCQSTGVNPGQPLPRVGEGALDTGRICADSLPIRPSVQRFISVF